MMLKDCVQHCVKILKAAHGIDAPQREARLIIAKKLKIRFEDTFVQEEKHITEESLALITEAIRLRSCGHSLAHLCGEKEFYSHCFHLLPSVLMPRPETELILDHCIAYIEKYYTRNNSTHRLSILDLCTGTGCIALSLAHACKSMGLSTWIVASDIDATAIENTRINNTAHGGYIDNIVHSDLFSAFPPSWQHSFSIITANPPYIASSLAKKVSIPSESSAAIDGGPDGLYFYRKIIPRLHQYLQNPGFVVLEIGHDQQDAVSSIMREHGMKNITCYTDLAKNPRLVCAEV